MLLQPYNIVLMSNFVDVQRSQLPLCVFWNKTAAGIVPLLLYIHGNY